MKRIWQSEAGAEFPGLSRFPHGGSPTLLVLEIEQTKSERGSQK